MNVLSPLALAALFCASLAAQNSAGGSLTVQAAAGAVIWVDQLRYGAVPATGELTIGNLRPGTHLVRARLKGRREAAQSASLAAGERKTLALTLTAPADKAELSFQEAEELRGRGKHAEAIEAYRTAVRLRPAGYPQARLGLARSLQVVDGYDEALANVRKALREKGASLAEAYTVLGNLRRAQGFTDDAMKNYELALTHSKELPEPFTGIALIHQDRNRPEETIRFYRLAVAAANDTEPVLFFLLGNTLEREYRYKEAVEVYEKYLVLDPQGANAASVRSVVKQLKREIR
ncbi:MAG: tetratricopeptide repeat protein [Blastocatellia bacterium]|nr:tetratricopeptide repeat protein [Blastocatellia bacterium]